MHSGNSSGFAHKVYISFKGHKVVVQNDRKGWNLPIEFDSAVTSDENKDIIFHTRSELSYSKIRGLYYFGSAIKIGNYY